MPFDVSYIPNTRLAIYIELYSLIFTTNAYCIRRPLNAPPLIPIILRHFPYDNTDLQLAAQLGKTLLERNKALELSLKQKQTVIEDQEHQIEVGFGFGCPRRKHILTQDIITVKLCAQYLNKQTAALREVNDSRLRIYENLEVNINDLEKTNLRLQNETANQKKTIKT